MNKINKKNKKSHILNTNRQYFAYIKNYSKTYTTEYLRNDEDTHEVLANIWTSLMYGLQITNSPDFAVNKEPGFYQNRYLNNRNLLFNAFKEDHCVFESLKLKTLFKYGFSFSNFESPIPLNEAIKIQNYATYKDPKKDEGLVQLYRFIGITEHFFFFKGKKFYNQAYFTDFLIDNVFFNEKPLFRSIVQYYQLFYQSLNYKSLFLKIFNSKKLDWLLEVSDLGELSYLLDLLFGSASIESKIDLIKLIHTCNPETDNQKKLIGCFFINSGWKVFNLYEFYRDPLPHDDNLYQDIKDKQNEKIKSSFKNSKSFAKKYLLYGEYQYEDEEYSEDSNDSNDSEDSKDNKVDEEEQEYEDSDDEYKIVLGLGSNGIGKDSGIKNDNDNSCNNNNNNNNNDSSIENKEIVQNTENLYLSNLLLLKIFNHLINTKYKPNKECNETKDQYYTSISKSIQSIALSSKNLYNLIKKELSYIDWNKHTINLIRSQYSFSPTNSKCLFKKYPEFQDYERLIKTVDYKDEKLIDEICRSTKVLYIDTLCEIVSKTGKVFNLDYDFSGIRATYSASFSTYFKYKAFPNVKKLVLKGRSISRRDFTLTGYFMKFIQYFIVNGGSMLESVELDGKVSSESSYIYRLISLLLKHHGDSLKSFTIRIKHMKKNWVRAIIRKITTLYPKINLEVYRNGNLETNKAQKEETNKPSYELLDMLDESEDLSIISEDGEDSAFMDDDEYDDEFDEEEEYDEENEEDFYPYGDSYNDDLSNYESDNNAIYHPAYDPAYENIHDFADSIRSRLREFLGEGEEEDEEDEDDFYPRSYYRGPRSKISTQLFKEYEEDEDEEYEDEDEDEEEYVEEGDEEDDDDEEDEDEEMGNFFRELEMGGPCKGCGLIHCDSDEDDEDEDEEEDGEEYEEEDEDEYEEDEDEEEDEEDEEYEEYGEDYEAETSSDDGKYYLRITKFIN
ncbi:hypothetical protein DICPUDRAFT_149512 [Dictyostelium purpureum]|uniref:Uncharacterized protein n=1 Tax=Dictyostelium purpureum TaxID=5786 RepID=F0ZDX8_DICPU|nr:uncharacterized protein DICPUDRAFT_149512 [Dictyostelium purpureum]EGC37876.1 hypothetical protein DICPUDRAFT_149512 [Dictyostelium purpureum]|eukprot:XP_003285626.1 hypothetical protein DICPUDRAFT_149512 [Dictyostelium purpureum]